MILKNYRELTAQWNPLQDISKSHNGFIFSILNAHSYMMTRWIGTILLDWKLIVSQFSGFFLFLEKSYVRFWTITLWMSVACSIPLHKPFNHLLKFLFWRKSFKWSIFIIYLTKPLEEEKFRWMDSYSQEIGLQFMQNFVSNDFSLALFKALISKREGIDIFKRNKSYVGIKSEREFPL